MRRKPFYSESILHLFKLWINLFWPVLPFNLEQWLYHLLLICSTPMIYSISQELAGVFMNWFEQYCRKKLQSLPLIISSAILCVWILLSLFPKSLLSVGHLFLVVSLEIELIFFFFIYLFINFLLWGSCCIPHAGLDSWCKPSFYFRLPSIWDYSCVSLHPGLELVFEERYNKNNFISVKNVNFTLVLYFYR